MRGPTSEVFVDLIFSEFDFETRFFRWEKSAACGEKRLVKIRFVDRSLCDFSLGSGVVRCCRKHFWPTSRFRETESGKHRGGFDEVRKLMTPGCTLWKTSNEHF